jgi:flagellar basal-body rod protein FlgB
MEIFDRTTRVLNKVLDLRQKNQQLIASNIANADTPGYAPAHLTFEGDLQQALSPPGAALPAPRPGHFAIGGSGLEGVQGKVLRTPSQSAIGDQNGVQLDQEMVDLAENEILYEAAAQMLNKKLALLKYVAAGGR